MKLKLFRAFGLVHMREQETYQKTFPKPAATSRRITQKKHSEAKVAVSGAISFSPTSRHEPQNNPKKHLEAKVAASGVISFSPNLPAGAQNTPKTGTWEPKWGRFHSPQTSRHELQNNPKTETWEPK